MEMLSHLISEDPDPKLLRTLWSIAHPAASSGVRASEYLTPPHGDFAQCALIDAVRERGRQFSTTVEIRRRASSKHQPSRSVSRMGKFNRIQIFRNAQVRPNLFIRFMHGATMAILAKRVRGRRPAN